MVEMAGTMMTDKDFPLVFGDEVVYTAVCLLNILPIKALDGKHQLKDGVILNHLLSI